MSKLEEIALGSAIVFVAMLLSAGIGVIGGKTALGVLLVCSFLYVIGFLSRDHGTVKISRLPSEERKSDSEK